jgi:hypothetical protein
MLPIADRLGALDEKYASVKWQSYDRQLMRKCNDNDRKEKAHISASQSKRTYHQQQPEQGYYQDHGGQRHNGGGYKRAAGGHNRDDMRGNKR